MRLFLFIVSVCVGINAMAGVKDSTINFNLPDSIKAIQFMAEVKIGEFAKKEKRYRAGIKTEIASLYIDNFYKSSQVTFAANGIRLTKGINVTQDLKYGYFNFNYNWKIGETYRLLVAHTSDSAGDYTINSGYIFLPEEKKWKLIGSYKTKGFTKSISQPSTFHVASKRFNKNISFPSLWIQRSNGSWKNLKDENQPNPVVNVTNNLDSLAQSEIELKQIGDSVLAEKVVAFKNNEGFYYNVMNEGTGKQVNLTDTVTVFYKGYLFSNGQIFDQTKEKPATFPLARLIKGWQLGLPLCKVGGKIKLIIPSGLAYSIRTRSAKIPPNSILVFEIEVVEAKESK